jgi:nucleoside-diphosphate-sugar epimerase
VTGATGALGPAVANRLAAGGYRVRVYGNAEPLPSLYQTRVEVFTGDICDRERVRTACDGVSHVAHLAALLHINNPRSELRAEYERVNIGGTQVVLEAALRAGVGRVVLLSTIAVYGYNRGIALTEETEPQPTTMYAETKLAAEKLTLDAKSSNGQPLGSVLRLAAVYGARVKGNYSRLVEALARGRFVPVGDGSNRRTLVHEKDVAAAVVLALESGNAGGRVYNVTDGTVNTLREVIAAICLALGRKPPLVQVPPWAVRAPLSVAERVAALTRCPLPVNSALLEKYLEDVAVDGRRIMKELGFRPAYDLHAGWQDAVAGMRQAGTLGRND